MKKRSSLADYPIKHEEINNRLQFFIHLRNPLFGPNISEKTKIIVLLVLIVAL